MEHRERYVRLQTEYFLSNIFVRISHQRQIVDVLWRTRAMGGDRSRARSKETLRVTQI